MWSQMDASNSRHRSVRDLGSGVVPDVGLLTDFTSLVSFLGLASEGQGQASGPARWQRQLPAGPTYIWGRTVGSARHTVTSSALGHFSSTVIRQRPHWLERSVS